MSRSLQQLLRPLLPNVGLRIRHVEPGRRLNVHFRSHLGLIARGAKAYEPRYVSVFKNLLKSGATVFDVGANIGFYTVLFSAWVGSRGKVVAYEPDPVNLKLLQQNLQLNDCQNVVVSQVALSSGSGSKVFSVDRVTRASGHLGPGATFGSTIFGTGKEDLISVITSTLDSEVQKFGAPDFIKMDIEGGEYNALTGAVDLLQGHRPLIVSELNSWSKEQPINTDKALQTTRLLMDSDYSLWDLDTGIPLQKDSIPWMFLAVPQEKQNEAEVRKLFAYSAG